MSVLLCTIAAVLLHALPATSQTLPSLPGDANCDGRIDAADVDHAAREIHDGDGRAIEEVGGGTLVSCGGADVNEDGVLTAADLPALWMFVGGQGSELFGDGPVITYVGLAGADGTILPPERLDPLPTFRSIAPIGFRLVVEAARGPSGLAVGREVFDHDPFDPSKVPDVQVLFEQAIGNGSSNVCDEAEGGVPSAQPASYVQSQRNADLLNDVGCRFDAVGNPAVPARPTSSASGPSPSASLSSSFALPSRASSRSVLVKPSSRCAPSTSMGAREYPSKRRSSSARASCRRCRRPRPPRPPRPILRRQPSARPRRRPAWRRRRRPAHRHQTRLHRPRGVRRLRGPPVEHAPRLARGRLPARACSRARQRGRGHRRAADADFHAHPDAYEYVRANLDWNATHLHPHESSDADAAADVDADSDADVDAHADAESLPDRNPHPPADPHPHIHAYPDADDHADADADPHAHSHADADAYLHGYAADLDADTNPYAHTDGNLDADADSIAHADPHPYADHAWRPDADADLDPDPYSSADPDSHADQYTDSDAD